MYCPKCGALLRIQVSRGTAELCCLPGEMCLSRNLRDQLERRYGAEGAGVPQAPEPAFSPQWHGGLSWYCPGDGVRLNDHLECPQCGKHIRDLVYVLIELHPHRPVVQHDATSE